MKLADTDEEAAFRAELRAWLAAELPTLAPEPDHDDWPARRAYDTAWQRRLYDAGYAGTAWPAEYGGRGSSPTEELIFLEETEAAGAPYVGSNFVGTLHAGPTLIKEGTPEQQAAHLPPILRGEHVWCQGFSEPDAGSDLASLATRAIIDGDDYVVTGRKIWTSHGHIADFCELIVRTNPDPEIRKQAGITWLIMPMDLPGIELRPLRTLTGVSEFNEMFLDEVRIPIANRVGAENDGWRVTQVTFSFERGTAFVSELLGSRRLLADLAAIAVEAGLADDASIRLELGIVAAELEAQWALTKRTVSKAARGSGPGLGGSVFKLAYHATKERMAEVAMRILGRAGLALDDPLGRSPAGLDHVERRLYTLSLSIAAGTAQIQRNLVGERLLGLPRDR
jgi:alkylation response protein AidB-like acyl-CoA dehydrogenase